MTSDKIKDILTNLGYKLTDCGNHWRTSALYRGGSNPTAVQVYKDSGVWLDYVKNSQALPLESLIQATLQTNDKEQIKKITGGYDFSITRTEVVERPKLTMEKTYPESMLDKLLPHYKFYNNRGISSETLMFFRGGLATEGAMYQRFVFPIYNEDGQIYGFSGRDMTTSNPNRPKWKHIGKKSNWIYPYYVPNDSYNITQQAISDQDLVILVESIGDLLQLHEQGIKNVLVTFGTSLSSKLLCFLVSAGCSKIALSLNNDSNQEHNRGRIGSFKSYLKLLNYFPQDSIIIHPPTEKDFGEMKQEQFPEWLQYLETEAYKDDQLNYQKEVLELIDQKEIPSSLYKKKYFDA
jgi:hypothetical protein